MKLIIRISLVLCVSLAGSQPAYSLEIGDLAPDFALQGTDGQIHRLSDYRGEAVVLAWFPKAYTRGCTATKKSKRRAGPGGYNQRSDADRSPRAPAIHSGEREGVSQ